jgi:hypothetical protein
MAATYQFTVPAPGVGQSTAFSVKLYQSATQYGVFAAVGVPQALSGLTPVAGVYTWPVAAADPTYYSRLVFLSSDGTEGAPTQIGPVAAAGTVMLECWTENVTGTAQEGLRFQAEPIKGHASAGNKTVLVRAYDDTDANGYASLSFYADSGMYKITLDGKVVAPQFDTAGMAGQTINLADILA